jgi:crotonobetainyl-CoA:carnitine CoA-transferase CaiB-like acyl-CoA transferase
MDDPQIRAREMVPGADHRTAGQMRMPARPIKMTRAPATLRLPSPTLGEHTSAGLSR